MIIRRVNFGQLTIIFSYSITADVISSQLQSFRNDLFDYIKNTCCLYWTINNCDISDGHFGFAFSFPQFDCILIGVFFVIAVYVCVRLFLKVLLKNMCLTECYSNGCLYDRLQV